jgi:hypothetical protein
MSNGPLVFCTHRIKYWATNPWDGRTVTVVGVTVDEALGQEIWENAGGANFSLMTAVLISAKLDANNATGIPAIDNAESWMAEQDLVNPDGSLHWDKPFESLAQRVEARILMVDLLNFMKEYRCD